MRFISVYEMKQDPNSPDLNIQDSSSKYIDEQYFNLSILLEKLLEAAREFSADEFITHLMKLYQHYTPWKQEQLKKQEKEFCQVEDFGVMLVNHETLTSNEEEIGLPIRLKNLRARVVVLWPQSEEVLSLPAVQMLQKTSYALSVLNNEYLDSYFHFSSGKERREFIKKLQEIKEVFDKIFFRMLPTLTADKIKQSCPYTDESTIAEDKKEEYDFLVKKYNHMQLVEGIAKKITEENKAQFVEGVDLRQQLFQKALTIYIQKNGAAIRNNLNNIAQAVARFNEQECGPKSLMTELMNDLSHLLNFIKIFHEDLSKESVLTSEEIKAFFEELKNYFLERSKQENNKQETRYSTQVGFACPQIEEQMSSITKLLRRMAEEPNIQSIFQCKKEEDLACCKAELEQLASCCENFAVIPRFATKGNKRDTNQGLANFIRFQERSVVSAITHADVFKPYYEEEKYDECLKESYLQLVSGLSAVYQCQFGGLLTRLRYGMTPEQKALKVLIAKILQHMTGESNNAKEGQLSAVMLHLRVQEAIDEYKKGSIAIGNHAIEFNPILFAKETTPILNGFKKDLVLKDIGKFDAEELQKSLQFRITRKVLKELKENGMSKLARREKAEGILVRLGQYWNSFLALFANDTSTQHVTVSPKI